MQNTATVHTDQIPDSTGNGIARTLFAVLQEYFSDPEHMKEFEEEQKKQGG